MRQCARSELLMKNYLVKQADAVDQCGAPTTSIGASYTTVLCSRLENSLCLSFTGALC